MLPRRPCPRLAGAVLTTHTVKTAPSTARSSLTCQGGEGLGLWTVPSPAYRLPWPNDWQAAEEQYDRQQIRDGICTAIDMDCQKWLRRLVDEIVDRRHGRLLVRPGQTVIVREAHLAFSCLQQDGGIAALIADFDITRALEACSTRGGSNTRCKLLCCIMQSIGAPTSRPHVKWYERTQDSAIPRRQRLSRAKRHSAMTSVVRQLYT